MIEIKKAKHIHFVGIKGVAMTALALCAQDLGIKVTGSDVAEIFVTDEILKKRQISWKVGFNQKNLSPRPDMVVFTGAHAGFANPEVVAAQALGIPVLPHAQALADFMKGKTEIITAGVGGKSTTAAMISHILDFAGRHPSFAVGVGNIASLGAPGRFDQKGREFVTEGDEFVVAPLTDMRPRFSLYSPKVVVLTNVEHDHPDVYPNLAATMKAFADFVEKVPPDGLLVANLGNENVRKLLPKVNVPVQTFGAPDADWKLEDVKGIRLALPGEYNRLNALAAFIVARHLGVATGVIKKALATFQGTKRRFEKIGEVNGILIYDDYAHHPIEIEAAVKAAREFFPKKRLVVIFQPHTYSRTKALFSDFAKSLALADLVGVMDIYSSAREKPDPAVSSKKLAEATKKYNPNSFYTQGHGATMRWIIEQTKAGDVVLTLGAGDIFYLYNVGLAQHTTLKIGGPAKLFFEAKTEEELENAVGWAKDNKIQFLVIGSGSNLLVNDRGFTGLVIKNSISGIEVSGTKIKVAGGALLQELVDTANDRGLAGVEKLNDIPGTVAGAICGNAGAYGQTVSDNLVQVRVFDGKKERWLGKDECQFEYRESVFKKNKNWIILKAEFKFKKESPAKLKKASAEVYRLRRVKYKEGLKSPGSFFKNIVASELAKTQLAKIPPEKIVYGKIPAGYLLESVGAKGARQGNIQIATYHGNLFLNQGGGRASDFYTLAERFQKKVSQKFGIKLTPEVQLVGFKQSL